MKKTHQLNIYALLKTTFQDWLKSNATTQAAALAYFTFFSVTPIIIIALAVADLFFDAEMSRRELLLQLQRLVGLNGSKAIGNLLQNVQPKGGSWLVALTGLLVMFFGAMGAFVQLQSSLNEIWGVETKKGKGLIAFVRSRLLSFAMVLVIGFLLLISLVISTLLAALQHHFQLLRPELEFFWEAINLVVSFGLITILFALMFKILPDAIIRWKNVWLGGAVSALLFVGGKFLIGLYLGNSAIASDFGEAGSVVVLLVWFFYSAQIFFFGAEFTKVYSGFAGDTTVPRSYATLLKG